ncbi:MAG: hypothetical protein N4A33_05885 [Bacteriovoracaceae bacterium]|nr:hypothetical protein [Bacteriovoracaceae bacterium]
MKKLLVVLLTLGAFSSFAQDKVEKNYPNLCAITLDYGFFLDSKKLSNSSAKSLKECIEDFKAVIHKYDSNDLKRVKFEYMTPEVKNCPGIGTGKCLRYKTKKADKVKMKIDELI